MDQQLRHQKIHLRAGEHSRLFHLADDIGNTVFDKLVRRYVAERQIAVDQGVQQGG